MHKSKKAAHHKKTRHSKTKKGSRGQTEKQAAWKSFWDRYCQM